MERVSDLTIIFQNMRMDFLPAAVLQMHPMHNKYGPIMSLYTEGSAVLHNRCRCVCV